MSGNKGLILKIKKGANKNLKDMLECAGVVFVNV